MKFALFYHIPWVEGRDQRETIEEVVEEIQLGEALGFHSAWFAEHHFTRYGLGSSLVMAGSLAARTKTIRLGTGVLVPPIHNPIQLAEDAAMLDVISNGRLDIGVGRGSGRYEYAGYGIKSDDSVARFRQSLEIMEGLWTTPQFSYHSEFYDLDDVTLVPSPVQKPHPPVYIGATRTVASVEYAAKTGHPLLVGAVPDVSDAVEQCRHFVDHAAAHGHQFDIGDIPFFRYFYCAESAEQARRDTLQAMDWQEDMIQFRSTISTGSDITRSLAEFKKTRASLPPSWEYMNEKRAFFGTPDACAAKIEAVQKQGIGYFGCQIAFGGMEHKKVMRCMELFAKEVMPRFTNS